MPGKPTRREVLARLEQAQRDGEIAASHDFVQPPDLALSAKTRGQVNCQAANASERERIARNSPYEPDA